MAAPCRVVRHPGFVMGDSADPLIPPGYVPDTMVIVQV